MLLRSALALAGLLIAASCGAAPGREHAASEAPLVRVATVGDVGAVGEIRASGLVGYKREPVLSFNTPGVIASISVDLGDEVRRGQALATLRRTSVGANPDEAALARANAERDLARTEELFARGFVSQARLDDARLALERARDTATLRAPADGVVLRRNAEPAQIVGPGTPVLLLGETGSGVVVRASLAASEAARIRVGDMARVSVRDVEGAREGRVLRIAAKGDEATGAFEAEIEVTPADGLLSGMVAEVTIAAPRGPALQAAMIVPALALLDARADQGVVLVVDEAGVARRRAVRTGGVTGEGVIVLEGLSAGERVVAAGAAYVRDGESVRVEAGG